MKQSFDKWIDKVFFDGWHLPENLNYLPEDNDQYQKKQSFDCAEMVNYFIKVTPEYLPDRIHWIELFKEVVPEEDIEIDYFINNNYSFALIFHSLQTSLSEVIERKIEESKDAVLRDAKEAMEASVTLIDILNQYDDPRASDVAKEGVKELGSYIIHPPQPQGKKYKQSEYRKRRNQEIMDKWHQGGATSPITNLYKKIAEDYPEITHHGVKKIIFSHDAPTPTKLQKKKQ